MTTRNNIVEIAREFLGSPFKHQGRVKDGIDCVGLIAAVCNRIMYPYVDGIYKRKPTKGLVIAKLKESFRSILVNEATDGDILVFWVYKRNYDQHVAIKTDKGMIHTYADVGYVVENTINDFWSKRIMGAFRFYGIK